MDSNQKPTDAELWAGLHKKASKSKYNDIDTEKFKAKFKSELVRTLYYMLVGYAGPHPWGPSNRPAYPEYSPIAVTHPGYERKLRETIESMLSSPEWDKNIKKLLRDLNKVSHD
jgi:hypothetical protein